MLMSEDRAWLLERHVPMAVPPGASGTICNACARTWPCPTVSALDALEAADLEIDCLGGERLIAERRTYELREALGRARRWLEGAQETFGESMDCGEPHENCDSYCERYRDMSRALAEIDAALAGEGSGC